MKNLFRTISFAMLALFPDCVSAQSTVLFDPFTLDPVLPPSSYTSPDTNVPARQTGMSTTYTQGNPTGTPGSFGAVEAQSSFLSPASDALFIRTATAAEGLSQFTIDLDTDFGPSLSGKRWSLSYEARSNSNMTGSADNWLAIAYGGQAGGVDAGGTGSDAFSFAVRENGQWLLWYRDAANQQGFVVGGFASFTSGQQHSVLIEVDETLPVAELDIIVTPLGGVSQRVVSRLPFTPTGSSARFEFRSSNISGGVEGQIFDSWIDNLLIELSPVVASTLFDPFSLATVEPAFSYDSPNANVPARQTGIPSTYTQGNPTGTPGSFGAIEAQSTLLAPASDALFIRTATAAQGLSQFSMDFDTDFGPYLSGKQWSLRYNARSNSNMSDNADNWLAIAYGGQAGGVDAGGTGNDAFSFALRENGQWLLWYRNAANQQGFAIGGISSFARGQQYLVLIEVDETLSLPEVDITVTPLGGAPQVVVSGLPFTPTGSSARFEFRSSNISNGVEGQIFDSRIDNFNLLGMSSQPFRITNFTYDPVIGSIGLTWDSQPGATYSIQYTQDLTTGFAGNLVSGVPSSGNTTTYGPVASPVPGADKLFFRVVRD